MKSFLIVDDSEKMLCMYEAMINHFFKDSQILITKACHGLEALEKTRQLDYTVILLDIEMPEMNGIEFHKKLEKENPLLAARTGFISGNIHELNLSYIVEAQRPYLEKPFSAKDLKSLLGGILDAENNKFIADHGRPCNRMHARYNAKGRCTLEPLQSTSHISESIIGNIIDYSKGGVGLDLSNSGLQDGLVFKVSFDSPRIKEKEGEIVWLKEEIEGIKVGLKWV